MKKKTTSNLAVVTKEEPKPKRKRFFTQLKSIDGEIRDDSYGAWSLETKAFLNLHNLKSLYFSEGWVYISVDSIAQPISQLPWGVYRQVGEQKKTWQRVPSQLDPILEQPNKYQSDTEFKQSMAIEYTLMGNTILLDFSSINAIYLMPTENTQINFGTDKLPQSYRLTSTDEDQLYRKATDYPLEIICHIKRPNPSSMFWGLSPFIPTKGSVLFNRYSRDYLNAFYQKGATPQMYLEIENVADEKQLVRLMRSFEQAYTGRRNMRRTMVLPKGVSAKVADNKIADQNIIELIKLQREEIIAALRVPKHALGLQESGSLGSEEHKQALKYFWNATIIPTADALAKGLTRHFKDKLRPGEEIRFDYSQVAVLQEDLKAQAELANLMVSTMTLNEVRNRVWGLEPIEGGDALPGKPAPAPMPFALSQPQPTTEVKAEVTQQEEPELSIGKFYLEKNAEHVKAKDKEYEDKLTEGMPEMVSFAVDLLGDQYAEAIKVINKEFKPNTKANSDIEGEIKRALKKLDEQYKDDYEKQMEARMNLGYDMQAAASFKPQYTEAMIAAKDKDEKGRYTLLKERELEFFKSVRASTTDKVMRKVGEALDQGWTVDKLRDEISKYVKSDVKFRAQVIARTEMLTAMSYGAASMTKTASEAIPGIKKVWVATMDERTRADHMAMHGEMADKNGMFTLPNGEKSPFPRGPGLSASQSIQCRCRYIDVLPEDAEQYKEELLALKPKEKK